MVTTGLIRVLIFLVGYALLLILAFVGFGLASRSRRPESGDFIVILGSTLTSDGRVPPLLAARLERGRAVAAELRQRGGAPVMIVSGGKTRQNPATEASAMAKYLVEAGESPDDMLLEEQSVNTVENLRLVEQIMHNARPDGHRCVIVTSDYHCPRVALIARRYKMRATVVGAKTPMDRWPAASARDFAALGVTFWRPATLLTLLVAAAAVLA